MKQYKNGDIHIALFSTVRGPRMCTYRVLQLLVDTVERLPQSHRHIALIRHQLL
jgi:hypothetical protein